MNKKIAGLAVTPLIAIAALSACGPSHSTSAASAKASSTAAATAADAQLSHDGYTPTHLPGFGKVDLGIGNGQYRYEAVYTYTGKDAKLMQDSVQSAEGKLKGNQGVTLASSGNLIVAKAATLADLKAAAKAVAASVR